MIFEFIALLSCLVCVADLTKCLFLDDELWMVHDEPITIDMNSDELKYYPFMISLNKCTESCNALSPKICVPKEKTDIYVKEYNMITEKAHAMTEHISCDCKCKFNSTKCNSNQK